MKKLSKVLSVICALVLVAGLGVTAFAAGGDHTYDSVESFGSPESLPVKLTADLTEIGPSYSVTVVWTDLDFIYSEGTAGKWNPSTHSNDPAIGGTWTNNGDGSVTVTNNSNVKVYSTITYTPGTDVSSQGVTVSTTQVNASTELKAGNKDNLDPPVSTPDDPNLNQIIATVDVSGDPLTEIIAGTVVGTFTATVSANPIGG